MSKSKLFTLTAIMFFDYADLFIILPILSPMILSHHNPFAITHYQTVTLGALVSTFGIAQLIGAPMLGALSDLYTRKRMIIAALILGALGYLGAAISVHTASLFWLFLSRFLIGFASGNSAILFATVADHSGIQERGKNMGYLTLGLALGGIIGPLLGGYLVNVNTTLISNYQYHF